MTVEENEKRHAIVKYLEKYDAKKLKEHKEYIQGELSVYDGKECPHQPNTVSHAAWWAGWLDGDHARRVEAMQGDPRRV